MKNLKHIFALLALLGVLFHSGAYTAVFVNFHFNQDFIAKNLCVNRFNPSKGCAGKCYLKKQFAQQEQQTPEKGLLTVQQGLTWLAQFDKIENPALLPEKASAPLEYCLAFYTQHRASPRPHPPCAQA